MSERQKMRPWVRVALFVGILTVALVAVALVPLAVSMFRPPPATTVTTGPALRVNRSELFAGELARLEPHLGLTAHGCVALEAVDLDGDFVLCTRSELHRAGHPPRELGGEERRVRHPREVTFSLREQPLADGRRRYEWVIASRGDTADVSTSSFDDLFPRDEATLLRGRSTHVFQNTRELREKERVAVWGVAVADQIGRGGELENGFDTSPCALVVYLWWKRAER